MNNSAVRQSRFSVMWLCAFCASISLFLTVSPVQGEPLIDGVVVGVDFQPVVNALVVIYPFGSTTAIACSRTSFSGAFSLSDIAIQTSGYALQIAPQARGQYPSQFWMYNHTSVLQPPNPIMVAPQGRLSLRIVLETAPAEKGTLLDKEFGSIAGKLYDQFGNRVSGARITVEAKQSEVIVAQTTTDSDGAFLFDKIISDTAVCVRFDSLAALPFPSQYYSPFGQSTNNFFSLRVNAFNTTILERFQLRQTPNTIMDTPLNLSIVLYSPASTVLRVNSHVTLYWYDSALEFFRPGRALDSVLTCGPLLAGMYAIRIQAQGYPTQYYKPSGNTKSVGFALQVFPGQMQPTAITLTTAPLDTGRHSLHGIVKNSSGVPVPKVKIIACDSMQLSHINYINPKNLWSNYAVQTDASGNFSIGSMQPSTYYLLAVSDSIYMPSLYPGVPLKNKAIPIRIIDSTTSVSVEFTVNVGAMVIGSVKDSLGKPLGGIAMNLYNNSENDTVITNFYFEAETNAAGVFAFQGVPTGAWYVHHNNYNSLYLQTNQESEKIITTQGATIYCQKNIILQPGGILTGTVTMEGGTQTNSTLGNFLIFPSDLTKLDSKVSNTYWNNTYINIQSQYPYETYTSNSIAAGRWYMVVQPQPPYILLEQNAPTDLVIAAMSRWFYVDGNVTLASTQPVTVTALAKTTKPLTFPAGGYGIVGVLKTENNDTLGLNKMTNTSQGYYQVKAYVKDLDHFVPVSQSFDIGNNRFILSGLIPGQSYYLCSYGSNYPRQWWNGITDSSTALQTNAVVFSFTANNYIPVVIPMRKKPQGLDEVNPNDGPSAIKQFTITAAGIHTVALTWSALPAEDLVDSYRVYRIKNATESLFEDKGMGWWQPVNEDSLMTLVDSFSVRNTVFFDTTAPASIQLMYVVMAVDKSGHEGAAMPTTIPLSRYMVTINKNSFEKTTTYRSALWHMMGTPGMDSVTLTPQAATDTMKLFVWDETIDSSKLFSYYKPINTLAAPMGAWLYTTQNRTVTLSDQSYDRLVASGKSITIRLQQGWNQISSPFPYPVKPAWLTSDSLVAYEWIAAENKYTVSQVMKPWKGYWVHSATSTNLSLSHLPATAQRTATPENRSAAYQWLASVSLSAKRSSDPDNFIGVKSLQSGQRLLPIRSPEPPQPFDFPQLYFLDDTKKYSHWFFPAAEAQSTLQWTVGISPYAETLSVTTVQIQPLARTMTLLWIDKNYIYNLAMHPTVSIPPHSGQYSAYIVAATATEAGSYSTAFSIKQNYPNPFRQTTTFEFVVPYLWNSDGSAIRSGQHAVSLSIYSITGRRIATLFEGPARPGVYKTVWNCRYGKSSTVAAGVYIARFTGLNYAKSIRLMRVQ
ncbi:MAG: carboxypeptidase regulatory-like domain-containing protein [Chitinivibrionales bacterium]|nr:carboxypeptidase regulatory-like domain-containing protein [Chitinivibrionales bacterium]